MSTRKVLWPNILGLLRVVKIVMIQVRHITHCKFVKIAYIIVYKVNQYVISNQGKDELGEGEGENDEY